MSSKRHEILAKKLQNAIKKYGIPDVPEYLTAVMAGVDPRGTTSYLYDQAVELQRLWAEMPQEILWELEEHAPRLAQGIVQLIEHILDTPAYRSADVSLDMSVAAANKLLEYQYPKLKAIEVSGELSHLVQLQPLTEAEIATIRDKFSKEY